VQGEGDVCGQGFDEAEVIEDERLAGFAA